MQNNEFDLDVIKNILKALSDKQEISFKELAESFSSYYTAKNRKKILTSEVAEELKRAGERIENGIGNILQALFKISKKNERYFSEEVLHDVAQVARLTMLSEDGLEKYLDSLEEGSSAYQLLGMKQSSLEALYQAAKHLYSQKEFQKAADAFIFLTFLDANNEAFWQGLGSAEFHAQNIEEALTAFALCLQINPLNYSAHLMSAFCYKQQTKLAEALHSLAQAEEILKNSSEKSDLMEIIAKNREEIVRELQRNNGRRADGE